jgi:membrane protein YqaA with SNARE-associated domain
MEIFALIIPLYLLAVMSIIDAIDTPLEPRTGESISPGGRLKITLPALIPADTRKRKTLLQWLKLAGAFIALIAFSFLIAYWFQRLVDALHLPLDRYAFLAYLVVFIVALVANLTVMAPVPIAVSIMITVAQSWNPVLAALAAALGGTIGELSGYYAGYAGRKIAVANDFVNLNRVEGWIHRWGAWAIVFLAFQPVIPFDVGGLVAGAARMPMRKFLPALFAGKLPKYILLAYAGIGLIHFLPESWFS